MQANRTGVCQECGMEYDIEAIKAMAETNKTDSDNGESSGFSAAVNRPVSNEIDRKALLIYLNDVRTLESIIDQSNEKITSLDESLCSFTDKIEILKKKRSSIHTPRKPEEPEMGQTNSGSIVLLILTTLGCVALGINLASNDLGILGIPLILIMILSCIVLVVDECKKPEKDYNHAVYRYNIDLEQYNNAIQQIQDIDDEIKSLEKNKSARKNDIQPVKESLNGDIDDVKSMLDKAYSANIIPIPFRSIEGVYYLYDYISSSNQSLSEALMQANLEAIKNRMDQVIKMQAIGIIEQAQTNAKLDDIQNQNRQIISAAERTAANSELTAKYSAITAINSEITKRILKRDLAYQRADFWLK